MKTAIGSPRVFWFVSVAVVVCMVLQTGCSRRKYRLAADSQAYDLVKEKACVNPAWDPGAWSVYANPRSRYFDTCDPDKPPMPPDDPASHKFMREVDGMKGWKHWYDFGSAASWTIRAGASNWSSTPSSTRGTKWSWTSTRRCRWP